MLEEARVHAGVAESEGFAIDADRPVLQRSDDVVGGILQGDFGCSTKFKTTVASKLFPALAGWFGDAFRPGGYNANE